MSGSTLGTDNLRAAVRGKLPNSMVPTLSQWYGLSDGTFRDRFRAAAGAAFQMVRNCEDSLPRECRNDRLAWSTAMDASGRR